MLSSRDTPFDEDGWALVVQDLRHLALLIGGGANDLNAGAQAANQITSQDISDALSALLAEDNPFPQYQLAANATGVSPTFYVATISSAGPTGVAFPTTLTGWTGGAGTLTGFNTTTGIFTPPANGAYAFSLGFSGTPASAASHVGLAILGLQSVSENSNFDTANTTGAERYYHESVTAYAATTAGVSFAWGTGTNWTNYTFTLMITRVA